MIFDDATLLKGEVADVAGATAITNDGNNSLTFALIPAADGTEVEVTMEASEDGVTFEAVDAKQVIGEAKYTTAEGIIHFVGYAGGAKLVKIKAEGVTAIAIKGRNRHI